MSKCLDVTTPYRFDCLLPQRFKPEHIWLHRMAIFEWQTMVGWCLFSVFRIISTYHHFFFLFFSLLFVQKFIRTKSIDKNSIRYFDRREWKQIFYFLFTRAKKKRKMIENKWKMSKKHRPNSISFGKPQVKRVNICLKKGPMNEIVCSIALLYFGSPSLLLARFVFYQWFKGNVHRVDVLFSVLFFFGWFCHIKINTLCTDDLYTFWYVFFSRLYHCFNILSNRFFIEHIRKANNGEWTTSDDESCVGNILLLQTHRKICNTYYIHITCHINGSEYGFDFVFFLLFCWTHTHNFYADLAIFRFLFRTHTVYVYTDGGDCLSVMSSINTCFYVFWHIFFSSFFSK